MSDNEYLAQSIVRDRLMEARIRAQAQRMIEGARPAPARADEPRQPGPVGWRGYWTAASTLMSRWRRWHPA